MSSLSSNPRATNVWFDEENMWLSLDDGRTMAVPKVWFPKFIDASDEELANYEMSGYGIGLHWELLDEDISVPNLVLGYGAIRPENKTAS